MEYALLGKSYGETDLLAAECEEQLTSTDCRPTPDKLTTELTTRDNE